MKRVYNLIFGDIKLPKDTLSKEILKLLLILLGVGVLIGSLLTWMFLKLI